MLGLTTIRRMMSGKLVMKSKLQSYRSKILYSSPSSSSCSPRRSSKYAVSGSSFGFRTKKQTLCSFMSRSYSKISQRNHSSRGCNVRLSFLTILLPMSLAENSSFSSLTWTEFHLFDSAIVQTACAASFGLFQPTPSSVHFLSPATPSNGAPSNSELKPAPAGDICDGSVLRCGGVSLSDGSSGSGSVMRSGLVLQSAIDCTSDV